MSHRDRDWKGSCLENFSVKLKTLIKKKKRKRKLQFSFQPKMVNDGKIVVSYEKVREKFPGKSLSSQKCTVPL